MTEHPEWYPPNPHQNPLAGYRQLREHDAMIWESGAKAGVKAVIERIEGIMGAAVINNGPRVRFLVDELWLSLRKEVGLE